jgi:hydroxyethylthiazole kinase-like uncharacterized protein yjeF
MKLFTIDQIRGADQFTIESEPVSSIDLMERASVAAVEWLNDIFDTTTKFIVVCGLGNNGGDGLAIARLLLEKKYIVSTIVLNYSENQSPDFKVNYERLIGITNILNVSNFDSFSHEFVVHSNTVVIDSIFGSGLNKPIDSWLGQVVELINNRKNQIVSIDIPTGLYADKLNGKRDFIVKANYTISFQFPKLSFMFPENADAIGVFSILDIGLSDEYITKTPSPYYFSTKSIIQSFLRARSTAANKGTFGHALIVAGCYGKMGAAVLSAKACLRTGAGLVTAHIPKCGYEIMQTSIPEIMAEVDAEQNYITDSIKLDKYSAVGIGPGIGLEQQTQNCLKLIIQNASQPIVFDADAINCLAENKTWLAFLPANSILTPHPKEFERLVGRQENSERRLEEQRAFSRKHQVIVVLKGAHTSISLPNGDVFFNSTGNSGMATAGSGDVLTGVITSLLAQGYAPHEAAILGVYIHGLAGDFAAKKISKEAMIASDIIENISESYLFLYAS